MTKTKWCEGCGPVLGVETTGARGTVRAGIVIKSFRHCATCTPECARAEEREAQAIIAATQPIAMSGREAATVPTPALVPTITCPRCGLTSYNSNDVLHRWCGRCNKTHDDE